LDFLLGHSIRPTSHTSLRDHLSHLPVVLQAPYFDGNSAVNFEAPFVVQQDQYATLINCVRDKVADELGKLFVMRTSINVNRGTPLSSGARP